MEKTNEKNETPVVETPVVKGPATETVDLRDGRKCIIREGFGRDAEEAMRISGSTNAADKVYMSALMSQCISIEGSQEGLSMEELQALPLADYLGVQSAFAKLNF